MKFSFYISFAFMITTLAGFAQRPPSISSPEVHTDNTITFKYYSRTAQKVSLSGEFLSANQAIAKDTSALWSITVGHVKPDIYHYFFIFDIKQLADPNNTDIFANEIFKLSIVDIPGTTSFFFFKQKTAYEIT